MAMLNQHFDASNVPPATPFEPIPAGKYLAQMIESEMKPTRAGDGQLLAMTFDILDGPLTGRKIWDRLNLVNNNAQTVEIAQRQLSAICRAVGVLQVSDSEQLHFKPILITVKYKPAGKDKQGVERDASNEVGGYEPAGGAAFQQRAQPGAQRPPAQAQGMPHHQAPPPRTAAPAGNVPPWKRAG